MKRFLKYSLLSVLVASIFSGCYISQVGSDEVAVKSKFGEISKEPVGNGLQISLTPGTDLDVYNAKQKVLSMKDSEATLSDSDTNMYDSSLSIFTKDGQSILVEMNVIYALNPAKVYDIALKYGKDIQWDNTLIVPNVRDISRAVLGDGEFYDINQNRDHYTAQIVNKLNEKIKPYATVSQVMIKAMSVPKKIQESMTRKIVAKEDAERAKFETEKIKQEAIKRVEEAKGIAKSQEILDKSITPNILKMKELELKEKMLSKWDGTLPKVNGSDSGMIMQIMQ